MARHSIRKAYDWTQGNYWIGRNLLRYYNLAKSDNPCLVTLPHHDIASSAPQPLSPVDSIASHLNSTNFGHMAHTDVGLLILPFASPNRLEVLVDDHEDKWGRSRYRSVASS